MKRLSLALAVFSLTLIGCQSAPPAAVAPVAPAAPVAPKAAEVSKPVVAAPVVDFSSIAVNNSGFSPLAQAPANTLRFSLHFARTNAVTTWHVDFVGQDGKVVPEFRGEAPALPPTLDWDGKALDGSVTAEGTYTARLTVAYTGEPEPYTTQSEAFVVDRTPPSGTVTVTGSAATGDLTFHLNLVPGGAAIANWRLGVIHPDGRRFRDFISEDYRQNTVVWNGRAANNAGLESGVTYDVVVQIFDKYGNVGFVKATLEGPAPAPVVAVVEAPTPVAAPVTVTIDGALVAETQIYFPANSPDLNLVTGEKAAQNAQALGRLAQTLAGAGPTRIRIVGHANQVFWQDKTRGRVEQDEVLIPLSLARASAVRDALVHQGLDAKVFDVAGVGADGNVAPFGDSANNWKNRRVEFVLEH